MNLDIWLFQQINQLNPSIWTGLLEWARYIALFWSAGLGAYLLARHSNKRELIGSIVAITLVYLIGLLVKYLVNRPRPAEALKEVIVRGDYRFPSFPSNETAVFFTFATLLLILFPDRWFSYVTLGLSILVGISRIYLGAHYPSDVLAGAVLGVAGALLLSKFF